MTRSVRACCSICLVGDSVTSQFNGDVVEEKGDVTTTQYLDGSLEKEEADGTVFELDTDKTLVTTLTDGTEITRASDGQVSVDNEPQDFGPNVYTPS